MRKVKEYRWIVEFIQREMEWGCSQICHYGRALMKIIGNVIMPSIA